MKQIFLLLLVPIALIPLNTQSPDLLKDINPGAESGLDG